jgi:putative Mg2+ transporter-C (MgtC) family protein
MLTFEQMMLRFIAALILGAILGIERELVGKGEAGVRTEMLVAGGAAMFAMIGITLPYIVSAGTGNLTDVIARNSGFLTVIANVVVGIGFLGAGIIVKSGERPRGLTTAALVWATAALGVLIGIGLIPFAMTAAVLIALLLYLLRKTNIQKEPEIDQESI